MRFAFSKIVAVFASAALAVSATSTSEDPRNYLIIFGDSWSRSGFNPTGAVPGPQNPMGNPAMPGLTSTGGINWVGYLATEFNASISRSPNSQTVVFNLATSGATVKTDIINARGIDLVEQINIFTEHYDKSPGNRDWLKENAAVGLWFGVNEVRKTYGNETEVTEKLFSDMMEAYLDQVERLYDLGLRKFFLITAPPIMLMPAFQKLGDDDSKKLINSINSWNNILLNMVLKFKEQHSDVVAEVVDASLGPMQAANQNPAAFGATDAKCTNKNGVSCLWWDSFHPAVRLSRMFAVAVAKVLQSGAFKCFPGACNY